MPLLLGVNIDHIATLRQARYAHTPAAAQAEPSPLEAGFDALAGGADSLTVHVRGDRRHMQEADAYRIRAEVPLPLNFEMGVTAEMLAIAMRLRPDFACLVPESREELTTEGGLDVAGRLAPTREAVVQLQDAGIRVSLFIDPDPLQVEAAVKSGARMIELHTGCFANAAGIDREIEIARLAAAARAGHAAGLQINAGHGLNYTNLTQLWSVPHLVELNIGHSIVARATRVGLTQAVRDMKTLMATYPAAEPPAANHPHSA
jgi:pyridoxine 5-phosphate synthase